MSEKNFIGIFDSGVGGLSVAKEIRELLPLEDILYFADSFYCPYGTKNPEEIINRCFKISQFLADKGAKMLVVACNTASITSLDLLRQSFSLPIIGMEPAVKPACKATKNGQVGVLATGVTLNGDRFSSLLERFANHINVTSQPCPGLVELVESGEINSQKTIHLLQKYLSPLLEKKIDTLVLGCTHYPFLKEKIKALIDYPVTIIDTGEAIAKQVKRVLVKHNLLKTSPTLPMSQFYTSGDLEKVTKAISNLLQKENICVQIEEDLL